MPLRKTPLVNGQIYHVFNKGIDGKPTFTDKREYKRSLEVINYYRFSFRLIKLSRFLRLSHLERIEAMNKLKNGKKLVDIIAFCLMPNHFHLLLRQVFDKGISLFMSNFLNSYTRYFNTKHERVGPLFLGQFKAVLIENDNQLLHVSRYVHLNPFTAYVVENDDDFINYEWSSFREYLSLNLSGFCEKDIILNFYRQPDQYKKFVLDQKDYQRKLKAIEHLVLE